MMKNPPPPSVRFFYFFESFCHYRACGAYTRNLFHYIYAYVCAPVCLCQRTHKYYNVSFRFWVIKVFISVKMKLKNKLFSEKIWWNGK